MTNSRSKDDDFVVHVNGQSVEVNGELDADTAPRLAAVLSQQGHDVELQMANVNFIDSSGLHVLIVTERRLSESGHHLTIVAPSMSVTRVLQLASLDDWLRIEY